MKEITKFTGRLGNQMFQYAYLYAQAKEGNIPDVYVQDYSYFIKYEKEIRDMFGEEAGFFSLGSIHVRRGDYVNNPFYVDLSKTDYYEKALALFPDKKFLVFSDDPDFAETLFPDKTRFEIVRGNTELEDMNLMASCSVNIIANSSFSWWAAFINPNPARKVVAPSAQNWYTDGVERTKCPDSWIRI